ncbi:MAG TPA: hypothetical protein VHP82_05135 [Gaiellaceae bacterium]|nr:hypothetical protein [Gaiellaceae bacterium]
MLLRERDGAFDRRQATVGVFAHLPPADRKERIAKGVRIAEAFSHIERSMNGMQSVGVLPRPAEKVCEVRVRHGKLTALRLSLQQLDDLSRNEAGLVAAPGAPEDARELRQRLAFGRPVAQLAIDLGGLSQSADRLVRLIGEITLARPTLQKLGNLSRREQSGVAEGTSVLLSRLTMRSDRRRLPTRPRRELEHGVSISGSVGVVREASQIEIAAISDGERIERRAMEAQPPRRRQRLLDRQASQLVPERDGAVDGDEHAAGDAFVESSVDLARERLDQPQLGMWCRDGHGLEHASSVRRQSSGPGQDRVANRGWDPVPRRRQDFRDEERVAARDPVELYGTDAKGVCELNDTFRGKGREGEA